LIRTRVQIWIAVSVYVLVVVVKKRLQLSTSLYEILQILSLCVPKTLSVLMTPRNHLSWRNDRAPVFRRGRLGLG